MYAGAACSFGHRRCAKTHRYLVLNGFSAFRDKGTHAARVFSPKDPKSLFTQNRTAPKKFL